MQTQSKDAAIKHNLTAVKAQKPYDRKPNKIAKVRCYQEKSQGGTLNKLIVANNTEDMV